MKLHWKENWPVYVIIAALVVVTAQQLLTIRAKAPNTSNQETPPDHWVAPSLYVDHQLEGAERQEVIYGAELIAHTSVYLGPHGTVQAITNGMNCQNCHLLAGRKAWGNNYGAVASTYPKYRDRSGQVETISKRINDCFERSLNGVAIDSNSREMKAIVAYIKWLGKDVPTGTKPAGSGISTLPWLSRAADPKAGAMIYAGKCQSCHGQNGEGMLDASQTAYTYPPLWGSHSYNTGAGLFRLSRFAGYIKDNMPFNQSTHQSPVLSDEEAWDLAAYVNSQPRPAKDLSADWPDNSKKPIDHPFGPYADGFSEQQHKYGRFSPLRMPEKVISG